MSDPEIPSEMNYTPSGVSCPEQSLKDYSAFLKEVIWKSGCILIRQPSGPACHAARLSTHCHSFTSHSSLAMKKGKKKPSGISQANHGYHRIIEYPELEGTHRDHQVQPLAPQRTTQTQTLCPGHTASSDSSCQQPQRPDPSLLAGLISSPSPPPRCTYSQGCRIPGAERSACSSSCRWGPPSHFSTSCCKASQPPRQSTFLPASQQPQTYFIQRPHLDWNQQRKHYREMAF